MQIKMWRTTKRDNSTATPASKPSWFTNEITFDVKMKETTDVLSPSFILNIGGHDGQNYVQAFGRYYWVTNVVTLANNLWEIQCKIDVLGSYRGHIRNTQAFVLYDSTANSELPDPRLGVRTTPTTAQNTGNMPWSFDTGDGQYFIAIEGDGDLIAQGEADGATGVYLTDLDSIQNIGNPFDVSQFWTDITDMMQNDPPVIQPPGQSLASMMDFITYINGLPNTALGEALIGCGVFILDSFLMLVGTLINTIKGFIIGGDALKHVKAAYWIPFVVSGIGTQKNRVAFGSYVDTIGTSKLISDPVKDTVSTVSIPWQYSDWRNVQNTEIQLYIPLIGVINIPASAVKGQNVITIKNSLNLFSGYYSVRVQCGDVTLGTYGADVKQPILIGDSNVNAGNVINTVVATAGIVAGAAAGGAAGATLGGAIAAANSGLNCIQPISTCVGGIGGGAGNSLGSQIVCNTICHNTSDSPSDLLPIIGTPTNVLKTLSGSGFCQTMQAHMSMAAVTGESYPTQTEVNQVNAALDSGVFLE